MEKRELTCIGCPMGCQITVELEAGEVVSVTGNTCKIGENYAKNEVTHPERTVTSTAVILGGDKPRVSVKTKSSSNLCGQIKYVKIKSCEDTICIGEPIDI